ncbi:hypothetical protein ACUSIJ_26575 [Pseudochelatococcus sp. B33]
MTGTALPPTCTRSSKGVFIRTISIDRATIKIGVANLAHNSTRYVCHEKRAAAA